MILELSLNFYRISYLSVATIYAFRAITVPRTREAERSLFVLTLSLRGADAGVTP